MRHIPLVLAALAAAPIALAAQTPTRPGAKPTTAAGSATAATTLPTAQQVIDRYVAAIGGRDALMRHTSTRMRGTIEIPGAGLKGDIVAVQAKPNKSMTTVTLPGLGEISNGFDGTNGWSVSPMQGPRVLAGKELEEARENADFEGSLRSGSAIRSVAGVEQSEMNGEPCYKVTVTYTSGRTRVECYSIATGLLVAATGKSESEMGTTESTEFSSDWKDFGGYKIPTKIRQSTMNQEVVITVTSVEYDNPEDLKAFEAPPAIQTILQQKGSAPASSRPPAGAR